MLSNNLSPKAYMKQYKITKTTPLGPNPWSDLWNIHKDMFNLFIYFCYLNVPYSSPGQLLACDFRRVSILKHTWNIVNAWIYLIVQAGMHLRILHNNSAPGLYLITPDLKDTIKAIKMSLKVRLRRCCTKWLGLFRRLTLTSAKTVLFFRRYAIN